MIWTAIDFDGISGCDYWVVICILFWGRLDVALGANWPWIAFVSFDLCTYRATIPTSLINTIPFVFSNSTRAGFVAGSTRSQIFARLKFTLTRLVQPPSTETHDPEVSSPHHDPPPPPP